MGTAKAGKTKVTTKAKPKPAAKPAAKAKAKARPAAKAKPAAKPAAAAKAKPEAKTTPAAKPAAAAKAKPAAKPVYVGSFGSKCAWYAVRSNDPERVASSFGEQWSREGWAHGCKMAYAGLVFVTQQLGDWVLIASTALHEVVAGKRSADLIGALEKLSARFGEAQYFGTDRVIGLTGYGRALDGKVVRAWAALDGDVFVDEGELTAAERSLGFSPSNPDEDERVRADELSLMRLAGRWSLDPQTLEFGEKYGLVVLSDHPGQLAD